MGDAQLEIPDPLRNVTSDEIGVVLDNISAEAPDGVESTEWGETIETIRAAIQLMRLDIPIEVGKKDFLPLICAEGTRKVRRNTRINHGLLEDPLVIAIREQIGIYLSIRVRLGRSTQFADLIKGIREHDGDILFETLDEEYGCASVINTMRLIVKSVGDDPDKRESVWLFIEEFLAEQAGVDQVIFSRRSAGIVYKKPDRVIAASNTRRRRLESLGSNFEFPFNVSVEVHKVSKLLGRAIHDLDSLTKAIGVTSLSMLTFGKKAGVDIERLEREIKSLIVALGPYFARKKVFDDAAKRILAALPGGLTELPAEYAAMYRTCLSALDDEFAELLSSLGIGETDLEKVRRQKAILDDLSQRLLKELAELLELKGRLDASLIRPD